MANDLQHVTAGQPLEIKAETWNRLLDAAKLIIDEKFGNVFGRFGGGPFTDPIRPQSEVIVTNTTGSNLSAYNVLVPSGVIGDPINAPLPFRGRPVFTGAAPVNVTDVPLILQAPLAAGALGKATIGGVTPCKVLLNKLTDTWAAPLPGDTQKLGSGGSGPARILWQDPAAIAGSVASCVISLNDGQGSGGGGQRDINSFHQAGLSPECWYAAGKITDANQLFSISGMGGNVLHAIPFWSGAGGTIDRIAFYLTGTSVPSGGKARLGVYDAIAPFSGNLLPNKLLFDSGDIDTTNPSNVGANKIACNLHFAPGTIYWFTYLCNQNNNIGVYALGSPDFYALFGFNANFDTLSHTYFTSPFTYGALPGTFPINFSGGTPSAVAGYQMVALFCRFASIP